MMPLERSIRRMRRLNVSARYRLPAGSSARCPWSESLTLNCAAVASPPSPESPACQEPPVELPELHTHSGVHVRAGRQAVIGTSHLSLFKQQHRDEVARKRAFRCRALTICRPSKMVTRSRMPPSPGPVRTSEPSTLRPHLRPPPAALNACGVALVPGPDGPRCSRFGHRL